MPTLLALILACATDPPEASAVRWFTEHVDCDEMNDAGELSAVWLPPDGWLVGFYGGNAATGNGTDWRATFMLAGDPSAETILPCGVYAGSGWDVVYALVD